MKYTIPTHLTDSELIDGLARCVRGERDATIQLVAHLAEVEARRLHLGAGFSSLFAYCCEVLRLSESATYKRIEVARAARQYPLVLERLGDASLSLSTARLLAPHLTDENHQELIAAASGLGQRAVAELVARRFPRPDLATSIRRVGVASPPSWPASSLPATPVPVAPLGRLTQPSDAPVAAPGAPVGSSSDGVGAAVTPIQVERSAPLPSAAPPPRPLAIPLSADRFRIAFTASSGTLAKLRRAQDLLRHAVPNGDPAEIVDRALTLLLDDLVRRKAAAVGRPAAGQPIAKGAKGTTKGGAARSRHIPAAVKRAVWSRDGGRCAFHAPSGRRCAARALLEYHHVEPFAAGGASAVGNIELRCRAHNGYEAVLFYGDGKAPRRASASQDTATDDLSRRDSTGRAASCAAHGPTALSGPVKT